MVPAEGQWSVKLAQTLWFNTYRARILDAAGNYIATLRIIPMQLVDRSALPAGAPVAAPYILALVEDAMISEEQLIPFESQVADLLLVRLAQPGFAPMSCQFAYPSPPRQA